MWPFRRPVGESGRSRLTREPGRRAPRLLRRRVSGARSAANESGLMSTAVRQTPLTAILAPSARSCITVEARTRRRAPAVSTVPSSSMIPVNIHVSFHCEFVRRDRVNGDAANADGVGPATTADTAGQRKGFETAQNLRPVIEKDAVDTAAFERRPVHLAAGLDHEREVLLARQPFDSAVQVGAASGAVEHQYLDAAGLENFAPLHGGGGGGRDHKIALGAAR